MMSLTAQLQETLGAAYTIQRELGGGGMSRVFLARDNALERQVVVKVLPRELAEGVSVDRFQREIMVAAGLQHPHIVDVLSAGELDGMPYFIMPYVEGRSLRDHLEDDGALPVGEAVSILRDVARALAYAHERGVVHRDIKPDNVLLASGAAVLTDFGVAKALSKAQAPVSDPSKALTQQGTSLGTPAYMAPEQAAGEHDLDHRADLYAFGVMAFEMLGGRPPFEQTSFAKLMAAHITEPPPPLGEIRPDLPAALTQLVMWCLEKDPADRPQSAAQLTEALSGPAVVSGPVASTVHVRPTRRRRVRRLAAIGLVLALGGTVLVVLRGSSETGPPARSVAVLPFVNVGGEESEQYFADGVTDEITSALAQVPDLRVASRTSAFSFRGSNATVQEIAEALNVATVLEGTIRRQGERVRLTAQLVDAADGLGLWSATYTLGLENIFAVQDSVSVAIVSALEERFGGELETAAATRRATSDLEAYDLYLRGRHLFRQRGPEALREALGYFERAVEADPEYAEAYAGMADVYGLLALYTGLPLDSVLPLALEAADRAIALDSGLSQAYASRGSLLSAAWRWDEALGDFQRAIALDPDNATAHQWYGENLLLHGRADDAAEQLGRATELDPLSPIMAASHAGALALAGRADEAVREAERAVGLDPRLVAVRFLVGAAYLYLGRTDEAVEQLEIGRGIDRNVPILNGLLGYAYAVTGQESRAHAMLSTIDTTSLAGGAGSAVARIHIGLGETDRALTWLERAADAHDPFFNSESMASPIFDPLRGKPRFTALLERVNLDAEALLESR